jgi:predicted dehydrogenase
MEIKIGIVGLGNIFDKHYSVIKNNKFFKIIAFCDKNYKFKNKNSSISFSLSEKKAATRASINSFREDSSCK